MSEALLLKLSDVRDPEGNGNWEIHLVPNKDRDLKSASAKRIIPLVALITQEEVSVLKAFLPPKGLRLKHPHHLLFHHSNAPYLPWKNTAISLLLSRKMRQLDGKSDLVFHHFRHTAFSNLHFLVEQEWELFAQYAGHTVNAGKNIYRAFIGDLDKRINAYRMLSILAGHSSPETTSLSYLHFFDRIMGEKLTDQREKLPLKVIQNLTGLSAAKIKRAAKPQISSKDISVNAIKAMIDKNAVPFCHHTSHFEFNHKQTEIRQSTIWKAIDHLDVLQMALSEYDQSKDIFEVSFSCELPETLIEGLIVSAKEVADKPTKSGKSRLISSDRQGKLAPAVPAAKADMIYFDPIVKLLTKDKTLLQTQKMCSFFLERMNTSESEIRITQIQIASRIVNYFSAADTGIRWHLSLDLPIFLSNEQEQEAMSLWEQALPNAVVEISDERLGKTSSHKFGIGKLSLMSPRFEKVQKRQEAQGKEMRYKKLASPTLRYAIHLLLIACDFDMKRYQGE